MPKKHHPSYAHTKPAYVHPSLQSTRSTPASPPGPQTVNERIQQLRREQTPRATTERRDEVTEVVTQRTAPPALRRILHLAEVDAPRPKPGIRSSRGVPRLQHGVRPPPGPAAPSSWLQASVHAPEQIRRARGKGIGEHRVSRFCGLASVHDAEFKRLPPPRSLVHHCLKTLALHWEELVEFEQHYIPALPVPLKEALLSYLSLYGNEDCLDLRSFKILFGSSEEVEGSSGADGVHFLDLTGLLNPAYSLKDLDKSLARSFPKAALTQDFDALSLSNSKRKDPAPADVVESWEDELDATPTSLTTVSIPIFPNLTRLSLAHPGACASWTSLLAMSRNLNTLTHLSLAYWPTPSTTPNATTTSMVSKDGRSVALGGSHFYSQLDDDWAEAANILRRLSHNTYCLKWLDLEGCTWHKALTWDYADNPRPGRPHFRSSMEWVRPASSPGPDWAGAWRQIEYLNLFQGWIPKDQQTVMSLPAGTTAVQLLVWLREHRDDPRYSHKFRVGNGYHATDWLEREKIAKTVGFEITQQRKASKVGGYCVVDHGWDPSAVARRREDGGNGPGNLEEE